MSQETSRIAGSHQKQEEKKKDSLLEPLEQGLANTLISDFWPPELQENTFLF